ncbi:MAG: extracellular solute-binding protein [Alphaproteobacteria bacterium]|nr:extracellular solute-binding protein [Alphaproteobacteria bacterium]
MTVRTTRRSALKAIAAIGAAPLGFHIGTARGQAARQQPFTIIINQSPWFNGFRAVVERYQRESGNSVTLDVVSFAESLEKQRNSVRARQGVSDLLIMNGLFYQEFYHGGFVQPIHDIDPAFRLDPQMLTLADTVFWNEQTKTHDPRTGKLMSVPISGLIPVLYYRADLYQEKNLQVPDTFEQLLANARALNSPRVYGMVQRGARGLTEVSFDWFPYFNGFGGSIFRNEDQGDFTVTINSPEGKAALDFYLQLAREAGHPQTGGQGQAQVIQNIVTGRAAQAMIVIAAWAQMEDPQRSAVVGKINVARVPHAAGHRPGPPLGHWLGGIPKNVPRERQVAALAFLNWFQQRNSQVAYLEGGAPPVRQDVLADPQLGAQPRNRWMRALADSSEFVRRMWTIPEGAQMVSVLDLRLNQAVIGEMTSAAALNTIADEIHAIVRTAGYRTGKLPNL